MIMFFIKLFTDTWIDNEEVIRQQYKLISKGIYNKMILSMNNSLKPEKVLWRKYDEQTWIYTVFIPIRSYLLVIDYIEDIKKLIRFIEDIKIMKL